LARASRTISVADVIQAIDGPLTVTACSAHNEQCGQFARCNVRDPLWKIRERIVTALATCSVSEMASESGPEPVAAAPAFPIDMRSHLG
jgi:DNA-binding IscR family transcriptional regulator